MKENSSRGNAENTCFKLSHTTEYINGSLLDGRNKDDFEDESKICGNMTDWQQAIYGGIKVKL